MPSYTVTCRRKLYFWYRYVQLILWCHFRPYDAYDLQDFIFEELEENTDKYLKITVKQD